MKHTTTCLFAALNVAVVGVVALSNDPALITLTTSTLGALLLIEHTSPGSVGRSIEATWHAIRHVVTMIGVVALFLPGLVVPSLRRTTITAKRSQKRLRVALAVPEISREPGMGSITHPDCQHPAEKREPVDTRFAEWEDPTTIGWLCGVCAEACDAPPAAAPAPVPPKGSAGVSRARGGPVSAPEDRVAELKAVLYQKTVDMSEMTDANAAEYAAAMRQTQEIRRDIRHAEAAACLTIDIPDPDTGEIRGYYCQTHQEAADPTEVVNPHGVVMRTIVVCPRAGRPPAPPADLSWTL